MRGIFVNSDGVKYAEAIVGGYKTIETRNRDMLRSLIGERVAVVRTGCKKKPTVIGYVHIDFALFLRRDEVAAASDRTLIPEGSKYDCTGRGKWCYFLSEPQECEPYPLPDNAIRHGRSWCEF